MVLRACRPPQTLNVQPTPSTASRGRLSTYQYEGAQHVREHDDLPHTNVHLCLNSEIARFVTLTHPTYASVLLHANLNHITSGSAA